MLTFRPISNKDRAVLREATYHNLNWNRDRFSFKDIDSNPKFSHYYNLGQKDFGFIAERHQQVLGVVWLKYFIENDPGFGYISDDIPELSISIFPVYRNCGFGTNLLKYTIEEARIREITHISLSVEFENEIARNLYEKLGFQYIDGTDGIMLLDLL